MLKNEPDIVKTPEDFNQRRREQRLAKGSPIFTGARNRELGQGRTRLLIHSRGNRASFEFWVGCVCACSGVSCVVADDGGQMAVVRGELVMVAGDGGVVT